MMWSVFVGVHAADVVQPVAGLLRVAELEEGRAVQIEHRAAGSVDPTTLGDEPVSDRRGHARHPGHLFDGAMLVEPRGCELKLRIPLLVEDRGAVLVHEGDRVDPGVDGRSRPELAARYKDVVVHWHVAVEVGERDGHRRSRGRVGI